MNRKVIKIGNNTISYSAKYGGLVDVIIKSAIYLCVILTIYYGYIWIYQNRGFEFALITIVYFLTASIWKVGAQLGEIKKTIEGNKSAKFD